MPPKSPSLTGATCPPHSSCIQRSSLPKAKSCFEPDCAPLPTNDLDCDGSENFSESALRTLNDQKTFTVATKKTPTSNSRTSKRRGIVSLGCDGLGGLSASGYDVLGCGGCYHCAQLRDSTTGRFAAGGLPSTFMHS